MKTIRHWFAPPVFPGDEEKTNRARILHTAGLYFALALLIAAVVFVPLFAIRPIENYAIILTLAIIWGIAQYLLFRGQLERAVVLADVSAWAMFVGLVVLSGGIYSPVMFVILATTTAINLILDWRIGALLAGATILIALGLAVLDQAGVRLPQYFVFSPMATWFFFSLTVLFAYSLFRFTVRNLYDTMVREREQHARFVSIFRANPAAIVISRLDDGQLIDVNDAWYQLTGFTPKEAVGRTSLELNLWVQPEERDRLVKIVREGGKAHSDIQLRRKSGEIRDVLIRSEMIEFNAKRYLLMMGEDITEHKKAERELLKLNDRYREAQRMGRNGHWIFDPATMTFLGSDQTCLMYGFPPGAVMAYDDIYAVLSKTDVERAAANLSRTVEEGTRFEEEVEIHPRGSSETLVIHSIGERFFGDDGKPQVIGILQDITTRKRAEGVLQQQNEYLLALQNTTLELVSQLNLQTLLENIVKRACALVGTSAGSIDLVEPATHQLIPQVGVGALEASLHLPVQPGEGLVGTVWQTGEGLIIPDYDQWAERLDQFNRGILGSVIGLPLLSGKQVIGVLAIGSPYGSPYHFDSVTIEILNQFARLAAVAVQNARLFSDLQVELTERKRAEEALRERDQQFRSITAASPDTLLVTRVSDGLIRYANEQAGRLVGLAASDLINRVTPDFYTHPEDRQTFVAMLKRGFVSDWEVLLKRADNTPFWAMVSARLGNFEGDAVIYAGLRDITDRKRREQELQAIATLITAARTAPTRAEMLPVILDQVLDLLEMGGATLAIRNLTTGEITFELGRGQWANFTGVQLSPDNSVAGHVIATGQRYTSDDVKSDPLLTRPDLIGDLNCVACVPLTVQGQTIGALWAGRQTPIREEEVRLLTSIADIAANAIHRATLHEQTQKHAADLAQAYDRTLEGWAHALELRDQETEGHTRRVVQMTLDLARAMGVGEAEMEDIRRGALLHDIGKMGVPDSVLLKPGTFNEREWEIMQRHSEYARNLLAPIDYLRPAMDIPYCHHEKWDGTGYPRGLKSEEIPIAARIFAIVDVWDALTSNRPYRAAWSEEDAVKYIREQSSKHFDPRVVEAFLRIVH